jgi:hypothetical protein
MVPVRGRYRVTSQASAFHASVKPRPRVLTFWIRLETIVVVTS